MAQIQKFVCGFCGESYDRAVLEGKTSRWCSSACRAEDRKKQRGSMPLTPLSKLLEPRLFLQLRHQVFAKGDGRCWYCGVPLKIKTFQVDHTMPTSRGGTHEFANLVPACRPCNSKKQGSTAEEFLARMPWRFLGA